MTMLKKCNNCESEIRFGLLKAEKFTEAGNMFDRAKGNGVITKSVAEVGFACDCEQVSGPLISRSEVNEKIGDEDTWPEPWLDDRDQKH